MSSAPPYYLIMTGGSLTIVTSVVILFSETLRAYYFVVPVFSNLDRLTSFALTLLPGLAILYLGQLFLRKPQTQLQSGLAVAALSMIGLYAIVGSAVSIYVGIFFAGPPISFTGGVIGAFLNRAGASLPLQPNPPL